MRFENLFFFLKLKIFDIQEGIHLFCGAQSLRRSSKFAHFGVIFLPLVGIVRACEILKQDVRWMGTRKV